MTLASTIVGGGIATVSAGFHERRRWTRDRGDQRTEIRRVLYGSYLSSLSHARLACSVLARDPDARRKAAWDAFEPCLSLRYQIAISGPTPVVTPAEDAFGRLRDLRDAITDGLLVSSTAYASHRTSYDTALLALRGAMRDDLGAET